jgi:hypothetical protein
MNRPTTSRWWSPNAHEVNQAGTSSAPEEHGRESLLNYEFLASSNIIPKLGERRKKHAFYFRYQYGYFSSRVFQFRLTPISIFARAAVIAREAAKSNYPRHALTMKRIH